MKPPRFPTVFEALVNAFACQQLSLVVGLELMPYFHLLLDGLSKAGSIDTGGGDAAER